MTDQGRPVTVVTGGAGGIGGGITRRLAARGDLLVVNDIDPDALAAMTSAVESDGGSAVAVPGDITDDAVVARLAAVVEDLGGADHLVNNVGDFRPATRTFLHGGPEQWQRLYDLNLRHVLTVTYALLPAMVARGSGAIVNVSTVEAYRGIPANAVYAAFKAGVSAFTQGLAVELGGSGVRVNGVAPDLADTAQTPAAAMLRGRDPELIRTWVPLGRFGVPDDYARVVEFLLSDAAGFVTGHVIPVDGGTLAASGWYARADRKGWTNLPDRA